VAARADTVSILLRPPELQAAREPYAAGYLSAAEFKRIEDKAVDEALKLQEEADLSVVTDGEMRREPFQSQLAEAVEGLGDPSIDAYPWGDWHGGEEVGDKVLLLSPSLFANFWSPEISKGAYPTLEAGKPPGTSPWRGSP
jgi:5-methyltetrahydropteroyltriglutamate--homocysteine methyltransferase